MTLLIHCNGNGFYLYIWWFRFVVAYDLFVVRFYYAGNIQHWTVTDFDIVPVENPIEFARLREMVV